MTTAGQLAELRAVRAAHVPVKDQPCPIETPLGVRYYRVLRAHEERVTLVPMTAVELAAAWRRVAVHEAAERLVTGISQAALAMADREGRPWWRPGWRWR